MIRHQPPKLARRFLLMFLRRDLADEVLGDLEENFQFVRKEKSAFRAKINYWFQVFNYLRPFALKRKSRLTIHSMSMLQNYMKVTHRTLAKQKLYAFINIAGLSIGLASFIMVALYVQHEFSYNRFYPNVQQLYRVYQRQTGNAFMGSDYFSATPAKFASVMVDELPEVEHATSVEQTRGLLSCDDKDFFEEGIAGDSSFFLVLPAEFVNGNPFKALSHPRGVVLTESLAKRLFPNSTPVGQMLSYQEREGFVVTGVVKDPPLTSSLKYTFIVNILYNDYWRDEMSKSTWTGNSFYTFFTLREGADPRALEKKIPALLDKYRDKDAYKNYPFTDTYFVQPITEMYFQPGINFDIGLKGNLKFVYSFVAAAALVLLLACVNYMNLAIARSLKRSREVGVRKVSGAVRRQIIAQFLTESVIIAMASLIIAIGITWLLLPAFSTIVERPVALDVWKNTQLLPGLFILVIVVGFISGSYPAWIMSRLETIEVLKRNSTFTMPGMTLQRGLIVAQFAVSIALIIVSLFIQRQLTFVQSRELGYDKEDIVTIPLKDFSVGKKFDVLYNEWVQNRNVVSATITSHLPDNITWSNMCTSSRTTAANEALAVFQWNVEPHFLDVFGMKLIAGRNFIHDNKADAESSCLINETGAKAFGWSARDAVGKQVHSGNQSITIIGVINDFHLHSMHIPLKPLMIRSFEGTANMISVKIKPGHQRETITFLENSIRKISPYPLQSEFLEDNYNRLYLAEIKLGEIFGFFTIVAIAIAGLGLFGLAAFACEQRKKEIGIRRVLGASGTSVVMLMSKDLIMLVIIAIVVATPVSWYVSAQWLNEFAYKINLDWWVFALAGFFAVLVANISIGYQSIRSIYVNPVDTLRME